MLRTPFYCPYLEPPILSSPRDRCFSDGVIRRPIKEEALTPVRPAPDNSVIDSDSLQVVPIPRCSSTPAKPSNRNTSHSDKSTSNLRRNTPERRIPHSDRNNPLSHMNVLPKCEAEKAPQKPGVSSELYKNLWWEGWRWLPVACFLLGKFVAQHIALLLSNTTYCRLVA